MNDSLIEPLTKDLGYTYPDGLDLRPMSLTHRKIVEKILAKAKSSYNVMNKRYSSWNNVDTMLTGYIELDTGEKLLKQEDARKPISIVVPYSYATLETILTYLVAAFMREHLFQYEGTGPEDVKGAKLLELVIDYQVNKFKTLLPLYVALRDGLVYGFGAVAVKWTKKEGYVRRKATVEKVDSQGFVVGTEEEVRKEKRILYEGNELINIDPYKYLPDPNVSIHEVQKGEFVAWLDEDNIYDLLSLENLDDSYFNCRYLIGRSMVNTFGGRDQSKRGAEGEPGIFSETPSSSTVSLLHMYIKLIPKEFNLGEGTMPEIWLFTVANEEIIIRAQPLNLDHCCFPVAVNSPDFDGYSASPPSRLEIIYGLQHALNWLFNSHIANVRKAINDMFVVDPSIIEIKDLIKPGPGKLIRTKRSLWGKSIDNAIKQFQVVDVTRSHISDSGFLIDMIQRTTAATDATMGIVRRGSERRTATEYSHTMRSAVSRLEKLAKIIGLQFISDLALFHASHTQQLMSKEVIMKVLGSWPDVLLNEHEVGEKVLVKPIDIAVNYDIIPKDGTLSNKGLEMVDVWLKLFSLVANSELLSSKFNLFKIFEHIALLLGAKNIKDFESNISVTPLPEEEVAKKVERGDIVPLAGGQ